MNDDLIDIVMNIHKFNQDLTSLNIKYSETIEKQLQELERLHSIIKEVREYITSYESIETINQVEHSKNNKGLDRDTMIEMINRHLKVHDKILEILDKVGDIK